MSKVHIVIAEINEWSGKLISIFVLFMGAIILYGAVMRYFFNAPPVWCYELSLFLFAIMFLLTPGYAIKNNLNVRIELFYGKLNRKNRAIADLIAGVFTLFLCGLLLWIGTVKGIESTLNLEKTTTAWGPHVWPVKLCIPIGALLAILQTLSGMALNLKRITEDVSQS